jgi:hypothetical protein
MSYVQGQTLFGSLARKQDSEKPAIAARQGMISSS